MKYGFKIGKVVLKAVNVKHAVNAESETIVTEDVILENCEVNLDISVEEMRESFSQFKEVCKGIKDIYIFAKEEIKSGEILAMKNSINELHKNPVSEEE